MKTNIDIYKLLTTDKVRDLVDRHTLQKNICLQGSEVSVLLSRYPCVIELLDYIHENYLEIVIADLKSDRFIYGGYALQLCIDIGFMSLPELRLRNFESDPIRSVFVSFQTRKAHDFDVGIDAVDLLLPSILKKGLQALDDGTFNPKIMAGDNTNLLPAELKKKYTECLG